MGGCRIPACRGATMFSGSKARFQFERGRVMNVSSRWQWLTLLALACVIAGTVRAEDPPAKVVVHLDKVIRASETTPTLQVVVNPPLRRGTPVHDNAFKALHDLGADYVRYVPWLPYPKLGVAE